MGETCTHNIIRGGGIEEAAFMKRVSYSDKGLAKLFRPHLMLCGFVFASVLAIAALPADAFAGQAGGGGDANFAEEAALLAEAPEEATVIGESVELCAEAGTVVFTYTQEGRFTICMNESCGPPVEQVGRDTPVVSPNSRHWAAIVQKDGAARVMMDGQVSRGYDMVHELLFSPDSTKLAYVAEDGEEFFVFVNQDRHPSFAAMDAQEGLVFSGDSKHLAYVAMTGQDDWAVVKNGKPGPDYDEIRHVTFSPDSSRLAYAARKDDRWHLVEKGGEENKGPAYDEIRRVAFSPDSEQLAAIAMSDNAAFVIKDGEQSEAYDFITGELVFSRDSERLAYSVLDGQQMRMVVDDEPGPAYDEIGAYLFSPDGGELAYMANDGGQGRIVHAGDEHPAYESVGLPVFSPDGTHLAYTAYQDEQWFIIKDGEKTGPEFDNIQDPVFCPDGERMAHVALMDDAYVVVGDGEVLGTYLWAGNPGFSPGGDLVYTAADEDGSFLAVEGRAGKERFFTFLRGFPPVFVEDDVVQAIALRAEGSAFYLLRAEIGTQIGTEIED